MTATQRRISEYKMTDWFPEDMLPARSGIYGVMGWGGEEEYCYFDADLNHWPLFCSTFEEAEKEMELYLDDTTTLNYWGEDKQWRGVILEGGVVSNPITYVINNTYIEAQNEPKVSPWEKFKQFISN